MSLSNKVAPKSMDGDAMMSFGKRELEDNGP